MDHSPSRQVETPRDASLDGPFLTSNSTRDIRSPPKSETGKSRKRGHVSAKLRDLQKDLDSIPASGPLDPDVDENIDNETTVGYLRVINPSWLTNT